MIDFLSRIFHKIYSIIFNRSRSDYVDYLVQQGLTVGNNFNMLGEVIIDNAHTWHITIGDNVTLAPRVIVLAHDASTIKYLQYVRIGKVKIGDRVFIGAGSIVLPGVTIGNDVVIGAGSVVSKDISSRCVAVGNPAKIICSIDDFVERKRKEMESSPCFGEEYTVRKNVTPEMKKEMNKKMNNNIGYIV